ncbi:MAG: glycerol acyltransferase [Muribaculaceae bacterium]|nr:glycerol acyltransferase [Muribaculaceae bacterium]
MDEIKRPLEINVGEVLRQRLPRYYRFIPRGMVRWLERTVCQDGLNRLLRDNFPKRDADFCRGVLDDLDVTVNYHNIENLPPRELTRVLFVSNHPLGGLDGMALIDFVRSYYGVDPKFIVNDLLAAVEPLSDTFLPVNKHGAQSRQAIRALDDAFASDAPLLMFPAGLVSRRGKKGVVADLEWQKMFVTKARQSGRDIIPLHFYGENSSFFYKFAKFRRRLGLKFNIEMIYLPREVFRASGKTFDVVIGKPISHTSLDNMPPMQKAQQIRQLVYDLDRP